MLNTRSLWIGLMVAVVFAVGLTLRFIMVTESGTYNQIQWEDTSDYYFYAYNLSRHGVYSRQRDTGEKPLPDAKRSPGYPLFLIPHMWGEEKTFLEMADNVSVTQVMLSALTLLIALVFFRGFLSWPLALGGGMLLAISPHLITINANVLTETVFTFFLVLFAFLFRMMINHRYWQWALAAGMVFGCALLVRPTLQYFLFFLLPFLGICLGRRDAIRLGGFLLLGFVLCYGPWMARNQITPGLQRGPSLATISVHKGMYPSLMYKDDPRTYGFPNHFDPQFAQRGTMSAVVDEVIERLKSEPVNYLQWYIVGKPSMLLSWGIVVGKGDIYIYPLRSSPYQDNVVFQFTRELMRLIHWPIVTLALFAALFVWTGRSRALLADNYLVVARFSSLVLAYFILVHIAGTPLPRYAIPIKPIIFGLALLGLQLSYETVRGYLKSRPAV